MYQTIRYEKQENIGIITIDRPEALNALNSTVILELIDVIGQVEQDGELLRLQSVISFAPVPLREVLARIALPYASLQLGFAPLAADAGLFEAAAYDGSDDYRLFFRGAALERITEEMLLFPALSHA